MTRTFTKEEVLEAADHWDKLAEDSDRWAHYEDVELKKRHGEVARIHRHRAELKPVRFDTAPDPGETYIIGKSKLPVNVWYDGIHTSVETALLDEVRVEQDKTVLTWRIVVPDYVLKLTGLTDEEKARAAKHRR